MAKLTKRRARASGLVEVNKNTVSENGAMLNAYDTDGTVVKVGAAITQSLNYNSFKVDVGLELPTVKANIKEAYEEAWGIIDEELARQQELAKEVLNKL